MIFGNESSKVSKKNLTTSKRFNQHPGKKIPWKNKEESPTLANVSVNVAKSFYLVSAKYSLGPKGQQTEIDRSNR